MRLHYIINRAAFFKGSTILVITTILSYILGLFRDRMLATTFGASRILDAYNAAFMVPDILLNIFVAGALSAAFVPIFTSIEDEDQKSNFTNSVLNGTLMVLLFAGIIAFIFAPLIANIVVPGFADAERHTYINLLRMLLLSPIIFAVSNTFGSLLITKEKFFWYGISAAIYNLGIILGVIFLSHRFGIYSAAIGALFGAILHLLSRFIGIAGQNFKYKIRFKIDQHYKTFLRLMIPKMIGSPVEQFNFLAFTSIASTLGAGSIAILNLSRNFQSAPIAVIGINFALAIFPSLSRLSSDKKKFAREVMLTSIFTFAATLFAALFMYLIRFPLIKILIGGGAFDKTAIMATASVLGYFALSIPTESVAHVLARAFYSLKNSIVPTIISVIGLSISITCAYIFSRSMGINGLALGYFAGSFTKVILMIIFLKRELK